MGRPRPSIGRGGRGIRVVPAGRRHPHRAVAADGLHRARLGGAGATRAERGRDRDRARGHGALLRRLHRRGRGGLPHEPRGRQGARGEPAGATPARRADARSPPLGDAVRPRGGRVRLPQGAAHPADPDDGRDGTAEPRPAAARAGDGRGAQRPAGDRRRGRARRASRRRSGPTSPEAGSSSSGSRRSPGPTCTRSCSRRHGTCSTSWGTGPTIPRPTRGCSRSSAPTGGPSTSTRRRSPTCSTRPSRRPGWS